MITLFHRDHTDAISTDKLFPRTPIVLSYETNVFSYPNDDQIYEWWHVGIYLFSFCCEFKLYSNKSLSFDIHFGPRHNV